MHTWRPAFELQDPHKKLGMTVCFSNPSPGEVEEGRSQRFADQPALTNWWAMDQWEKLFLAKNQDGWLVRNHNQGWILASLCTCNYTHVQQCTHTKNQINLSIKYNTNPSVLLGRSCVISGPWYTNSEMGTILETSLGCSENWDSWYQAWSRTLLM